MSGLDRHALTQNRPLSGERLRVELSRGLSIGGAASAASVLHDDEVASSRTDCLAETASGRVVLDALIATEILVVALAGLAVKFFYVDLQLGPEPFERYFAPIGLAGLVQYHVFAVRGLHSARAFTLTPTVASRLGAALLVVFAALIAAGYLAGVADDYSRGWVLLWLGLAFALLLACRALATVALRRGVVSGRFREIVLVCGEGRALSDAVAALTERSNEVVIGGTFGLDGKPRAVAGVNVGAVAQDISTFADQHPVDQVIVAVSPGDTTAMERLMPMLDAMPCDVHVIAGLVPHGVPHAIPMRRGRLVLAGLRQRPIAGWSAVVKAGLDFTVAGIALVALAPVFAAIALAIKLDSPGPVFFRQRRHGFNNEIFEVWKFRTMRVLEDGATIRQAERNDARITAVGHFLRKTSLDELPQLINVLKGEMSLVGPRPHAVAHNLYYADAVKHYARRHKVKPGITGWAQINGFRGPTADPEAMRRRVEHDLEYIRNWSLWLDLKILALTPFFGLMGRNAF